MKAETGARARARGVTETRAGGRAREVAETWSVDEVEERVEGRMVAGEAVTEGAGKAVMDTTVAMAAAPSPVAETLAQPGGSVAASLVMIVAGLVTMVVVGLAAVETRALVTKEAKVKAKEAPSGVR